ncbi:hypothetical protein BHK98_07110 [Hornefia porci]|uniref:Uncharacterized protein n=1 Tax=Hornefia porci TaxID=2652292 RepID=A0A1Q9JI99_9FIRM|nr:hypothetical protein [Hornefia porci]OLR55847.1 hypothetical protein BHK98_07110 [Hornefia porci]
MSKNTTKKKSGSVIVWVFYILAILMLALTCYMVYSAISYLANYASQYGTTLSSMKGDVFQYTLQQAAPYLTYTILIFGIGKVLDTVNKIVPAGSAASGATTSDALSKKSVKPKEAAETAAASKAKTKETAEKDADADAEKAADNAAEGTKTGDDTEAADDAKTEDDVKKGNTSDDADDGNKTNKKSSKKK